MLCHQQCVVDSGALLVVVISVSFHRPTFLEPDNHHRPELVSDVAVSTSVCQAVLSVHAVELSPDQIEWP